MYLIKPKFVHNQAIKYVIKTVFNFPEAFAQPRFVVKAQCTVTILTIKSINTNGSNIMPTHRHANGHFDTLDDNWFLVRLPAPTSTQPITNTPRAQHSYEFLWCGHNNNLNYQFVLDAHSVWSSHSSLKPCDNTTGHMLETLRKLPLFPGASLAVASSAGASSRAFCVTHTNYIQTFGLCGASRVDIKCAHVAMYRSNDTHCGCM